MKAMPDRHLDERVSLVRKVAECLADTLLMRISQDKKNPDKLRGEVEARLDLPAGLFFPFPLKIVASFVSPDGDEAGVLCEGPGEFLLFLGDALDAGSALQVFSRYDLEKAMEGLAVGGDFFQSNDVESVAGALTLFESVAQAEFARLPGETDWAEIVGKAVKN